MGVHCYSSGDLYNWKDEGVVLPVVKDDPGHDLAVGSIVERPKVIHNRKTGKFVMWFHLERKGTGYTSARSGVAVADRVTGPYTYRGSFRPNAGAWPRGIRPEQKVRIEAAARNRYSGGELPDQPDRLNLVARDFEGGQMARDQTLFVDDDGTAYHVYASEENSTLHISRLADDYLAPAGDYVRVFPGRFMEAPAVFKHEGRYYFIGSGCTGWAPNAARSAVADSIWGPWTELGNPAVGPGAERTFESQSTFVLPVRGRPGAFIFMADRWRPENAIDGRYVWLPILFRNGRGRAVEVARQEWRASGAVDKDSCPCYSKDMAKVTSKLQVTVPKAIAERFGIRPGDDIEWRAEGNAIRVLPRVGEDGPLDREARLRSFDEATARQQPRNRLGRRARRPDRGWTREELYDRARPR